MQRHLLVLRLDHVLDYVGARGVAPRVAKPLSGSVAFHHTGRVVVPAIPVEKQVKLNFSNSKTVFIIQVYRVKTGLMLVARLAEVADLAWVTKLSG